MGDEVVVAVVFIVTFVVVDVIIVVVGVVVSVVSVVDVIIVVVVVVIVVSVVKVRLNLQKHSDRKGIWEECKAENISYRYNRVTPGHLIKSLYYRLVIPRGA